MLLGRQVTQILYHQDPKSSSVIAQALTDIERNNEGDIMSSRTHAWTLRIVVLLLIVGASSPRLLAQQANEIGSGSGVERRK